MRYLWLLVGFMAFQVHAQNLNEERIWKLVPRKKSIYLSHGIFHLNDGARTSITGLRSSFVRDRGYERVVIDFAGATSPKLYGYIDAKANKLSIDFFDSSVTPQITALRNTRHVKSVDFMAIDQNQVTMDMKLKDNVNFDIFYLENPGRLVIDIRP